MLVQKWKGNELKRIDTKKYHCELLTCLAIHLKISTNFHVNAHEQHKVVIVSLEACDESRSRLLDW